MCFRMAGLKGLLLYILFVSLHCSASVCIVGETGRSRQANFRVRVLVSAGDPVCQAQADSRGCLAGCETCDGKECARGCHISKTISLSLDSREREFIMVPPSATE
jgi:hypothetical protein